MGLTRPSILFLCPLAALPGCFLALDEGALTRGADGSDRDAPAIPDLSSLDATDAASLDGAPDAPTALDLANGFDELPIDQLVALDLRPLDGPRADFTQPPDLALPPCTALLCDDFESGAIDAPWVPSTMNGSVTVDTLRAARGSHALHASLMQEPSGSQAVGSVGEGTTFSGAQPNLYARAFFYLPSPPPPVPVVLMTFYEDTAPYDGSDLIVDQRQLVISNRVAGTTHSSTTKMPLDRWTCVEFHVQQATANGGGFDVWLDGQAIGDLAIAGETTRPSASQITGFNLEAGVYYAPVAIPALDLFADSVIVDTARSGCAR